MMPALTSAISGLQNNTTWMDIIGDNIANESTVGYKETRVTFKQAISETLGSASGANATANQGGINPEQLGLGVTLGSLDTIMTQGSLQTTGNATDVAIQGNGFFIAQSGSQTLYTRAGNFNFDNQGNLVTSSGALVQGWQMNITRAPGAPGPLVQMLEVTSSLNNNTLPAGIQIPQNLVLGPSATGNSNLTVATDRNIGVAISGNLDAMTPWNAIGAPGAAQPLAGYVPDATSTATVYDSIGTAHQITIYWTQTGNPTGLAAPAPAAGASNWAWTAYDTTGGKQIGAAVPAANQAAVVGTGVGVTFNSDGSLRANSAAGALNPVITITPLVDGAGALGAATQIVSLNFGTDDAMSTTGIGLRDGITGDYGNGTTVAGVYTPKQTIYTSHVDGYSEGTLTSLSVDSSGQINVSFSNNQTIAMAQLALANFTNPEGLDQAGGTMFTQSANSGTPQISQAGNAGLGTIAGGELESSNVDLSVELTNMIIAQRGFDANSRIVTTSSQMLTTLVQLGQ
jgi:flagellar hook protein FlgE